MPAGMRAPIRVPFDRLLLDPNNPRLADEHAPGYDDPARLMDSQVQAELEERVKRVYRVRPLVSSILGMGWVPIDPILVWELPGARGHYLVVEGNTRTVALRHIRRTLEKERARLGRLSGRESEALATTREAVARHEQAVAATAEIEVVPVEAHGTAELHEVLPKLLGVRHLTNAQKWKPHAVNLYVYGLYERAFRESHGEKMAIHMDDAPLGAVAATLSQSPYRLRRGIQSAAAFSSFRKSFTPRLPKGESILDVDQDWFIRIFEPGHAYRSFGVKDADMALSPEMEEVLFDWAFSKPRGEDEKNRNILRDPDDISLWNRMARYDAEHGTRFAQALDPRHPTKARPLVHTEATFDAHREQQSPVEVLSSLADKLRHLDVGTLRGRKDEIRPVLDDIGRLARDAKKMLSALG